MVIFHSYVKLPEGISHMIWMYLTLTTWNAEFLGQGNRANQLPALSKSQNEHGFFPGDSSNRSLQILYWYQFLVGGLEHDFYDFPFSWEFHHPDWRTPIIFQRGRYTTNQIQTNVLWKITIPEGKSVLNQPVHKGRRCGFWTLLDLVRIGFFDPIDVLDTDPSKRQWPICICYDMIYTIVIYCTTITILQSNRVLYHIYIPSIR